VRRGSSGHVARGQSLSGALQPKRRARSGCYALACLQGEFFHQMRFEPVQLEVADGAIDDDDLSQQTTSKVAPNASADDVLTVERIPMASTES
jgi:hypothetical protein